MSELSDRDRAVLEFEIGWVRDGLGRSERKQERIRDEFGLSLPRYYQVLNRVIDEAEAVEMYPLEVHGLVRQRDARVAARSARRM